MVSGQGGTHLNNLHQSLCWIPQGYVDFHQGNDGRMCGSESLNVCVCVWDLETALLSSERTYVYTNDMFVIHRPSRLGSELSSTRLSSQGTS
ncbi:hypothetical protein RRG08_013993 [Elysia crispata]|uniref:Uncharacterized protein n=1 Tax=Elysia crispata TaxID=231223 RepID=A0AAE0Z3D4_9GAST|nr:hypothetical protein RRG08_013993 [Elysia crispata]